MDPGNRDELFRHELDDERDNERRQWDTRFWKIEMIPTTGITTEVIRILCFPLTESTAGSVELSGIRITRCGIVQFHRFVINLWNTSNGKPILIHDCWFSVVPDIRSYH